MVRRQSSWNQACLAKQSEVTVLCRVLITNSVLWLEGPNFLAVAVPEKKVSVR